MLTGNEKIGLIGNQSNDSDSSLIQEALKKEIEKENLLDVHQLKEGQRVSIGNVLFKIQRVRPDFTIVLKPVGNI